MTCDTGEGALHVSGTVRHQMEQDLSGTISHKERAIAGREHCHDVDVHDSLMLQTTQGLTLFLSSAHSIIAHPRTHTLFAQANAIRVHPP